METTTLTRGTVTKSDLEFEKSLKNTEHIVREDETEVGMQLLLQRMSTQNIKTDGKTKKVFDDYASKRTVEFISSFCIVIFTVSSECFGQFKVFWSPSIFFRCELW